MRRILLLFMLVLIVFTSISYADNIHYRIVVYPGPGNTTVLFTDTTSYEIQYDSNYNLILPNYGNVVEIVLYNPTGNDIQNEIVKIDVSGLNITDPNSIYFVDEYGNVLEYDAHSVSEYGLVFVKVNVIKANDNLTVYMFYDGDNPYSSYNRYLASVNMTIDFRDESTTLDGWFQLGGASFDITTYNNERCMHVNIQSYQVVVYNIPLDTTYDFYIEAYGYFDSYTGSSMAKDNNYYYIIRPFNSQILKIDPSGAVLFNSGDTSYATGYHTLKIYKQGTTITGECDGTTSSITDNDPYNPVYPGVSGWISSPVDIYIYYVKFQGIRYINTSIQVVSMIYLGKIEGRNYLIDNSNGLYAIMGSRYKSWFALGDGSNYPVRIVYDSGFTFYIGSTSYGGGDIGYDNDYFLYRICFDDSWHFIINDFYTGQYLSKDTGDTSVFSFNETYITKPYLFYIVFAPYRSDYVIIHIRAPPNYYVDNVTVQYMYAYYQNDNVYIWFEGNDAYIKLGYTNNYNAYYPLIVQFDLKVGDLPDRNTYDASRDPYSGLPTSTTTTTTASLIITTPPAITLSGNVSGWFSPSFSVDAPNLVSPQGLLVLGMFVGLFIVHSRVFPWGQALAVSSAICMIISIALFGLGMFSFFLVFFVVGLGAWKILGK